MITAIGTVLQSNHILLFLPVSPASDRSVGCGSLYGSSSLLLRFSPFSRMPLKRSSPRRVPTVSLPAVSSIATPVADCAAGQTRRHSPRREPCSAWFGPLARLVLFGNLGDLGLIFAFRVLTWCLFQTPMNRMQTSWPLAATLSFQRCHVSSQLGLWRYDADGDLGQVPCSRRTCLGFLFFGRGSSAKPPGAHAGRFPPRNW